MEVRHDDEWDDYIAERYSNMVKQALDDVVEQEDVGGWCEIFCCDNDGYKEVPASVDSETVGVRYMCRSCEEAYSIGAQYGMYRAYRMLKAAGYELPAQVLKGVWYDPLLEELNNE